jgi:antitoxin component YwqK of YwqJK toxin-antitoxin module
MAKLFLRSEFMKLFIPLFLLLVSTPVFAQRPEEKIVRFPNGNIREKYSFYRKSDGKEILHGKRIAYFDNGTKFDEGELRNGKFEGLRTFWYETGQKQSEGYYKNDLPIGFWSAWHRNGKKALECNYKNGQFDGICLYWNEQGRQIDRVNYIEGVPKAFVEWAKKIDQMFFCIP